MKNHLFFSLLLVSAGALHGMQPSQGAKLHLAQLPPNAQIKIIEYLCGPEKLNIGRGIGAALLYLGMENQIPQMIQASGLTPRQVGGVVSIAHPIYQQKALALIPSWIPKMSNPAMRKVLQKALDDQKTR